MCRHICKALDKRSIPWSKEVSTLAGIADLVIPGYVIELKVMGSASDLFCAVGQAILYTLEHNNRADLTADCVPAVVYKSQSNQVLKRLSRLGFFNLLAAGIAVWEFDEFMGDIASADIFPIPMSNLIMRRLDNEWVSKVRRSYLSALLPLPELEFVFQSKLSIEGL